MAWDRVHLFECPTRVRYGAGAAAESGSCLAELDVTRALLVSDPGVQAAGAVDRVAESLHGAGVDVVPYLEVEPNPTTQNVDEIACMFAEQGCDGLLGLGGGSAMDAAKAASALVANGGTIASYAGKDKVPEAGPPVLCMPTTCGTGAEVTFVVVITDPDTHFKIVCASRNLAARAALVDPELVLTAPASVIAATGADALAHATESFVNLGSDPLLDSINIAAVRMIGRNLRQAVNEGDRDAIGQLSLASTMTGIAFNMNANAVVHAASTPVTAHHGVPHGVANAVFLAEGLDLLRPACEDKLAAVAVALGEDVGDLPASEAAIRAVDAVKALLRDVGLPATLRDFGLDPDDIDIPTLIEDAMKSRNIATNPRPVGPPELDTLYRAVIG